MKLGWQAKATLALLAFFAILAVGGVAWWATTKPVAEDVANFDLGPPSRADRTNPDPPPRAIAAPDAKAVPGPPARPSCGIHGVPRGLSVKVSQLATRPWERRAGALADASASEGPDGALQVEIPGGVGAHADEPVVLLVEVEGQAPRRVEVPVFGLGSDCGLTLPNPVPGGRVRGRVDAQALYDEAIWVDGCGSRFSVAKDGSFEGSADAGPCTLVASRGSGFRGVISGPAVRVTVLAGGVAEVDLSLPSWEGYGDIGFKLHPEDTTVLFVDDRCLAGPDAPRVGEDLTAVDGRSTSQMSREELVRLLTGPTGSVVRVEFEGSRTMELPICRPSSGG